MFPASSEFSPEFSPISDDSGSPWSPQSTHVRHPGRVDRVHGALAESRPDLRGGLVASEAQLRRSAIQPDGDADGDGDVAGGLRDSQIALYRSALNRGMVNFDGV